MHAEELHRLDLEVATQSGRVAISVGGELDTTTAPRLISAAHDLLEGRRIRCMEVDCDDVWFLDSAGVRALIVMRNEAVGMGIDFAIVRASQTVSRILDMTGLTAILTRSASN